MIIRTFIIFCLLLVLTITGISAQEFCSRFYETEVQYTSVSPAYSESENCYDVKFYNLSLEVSDTSTFLKGNSEVVFKALETIDTLVIELSNTLFIDSVYLNNEPVNNYLHQNKLIIIPSSVSLQENTINSLRVIYKGGTSNEGFFSGISNRTDFRYETPVTYTLSEPFQSSNWFPVKQNLVDKADSVRIVITTDSSLMAGSNGILTSVESKPNGKIKYTWESHYPIAYYLISIAVSDYQDYSFYAVDANKEDSVLVQNFIYDHPSIFTAEKAKIDETARMILLFSELFGDYPFKEEKYGHCMAPIGGGMEHQTMTTLQTFSFDLVSHELAHQWFGDNVTCASWQDIWVNEGFASYSEYLAREFLQGLPQAINWMTTAQDNAMNSRDGSVYISEEESKNEFRIFDYRLSYKKGAAILHMLRNEINNDSLFFRTFKDFQTRFDDSTAYGRDFENIVNEVTGDNFSWFFDQWYYGKGFPVVQATWRQRSDSLLLEVFQGNSSGDSGFFRMHIDFLIEFSDDSDSLVRILIDSDGQRFSFPVTKKIEDVQMDPFNKNLMQYNLYEYISDENEIEVSPNPFTDTLYMDFQDQSSSKSLIISNIKGELVYEAELGTVSSFEMDLSHLSAGIYLLVVKTEDHTKALRIVKL